MLFSIIVPIYNVEPYIERCIASLRAQTYQDIEIDVKTISYSMWQLH